MHIHPSIRRRENIAGRACPQGAVGFWQNHRRRPFGSSILMPPHGNNVKPAWRRSIHIATGWTLSTTGELNLLRLIAGKPLAMVIAGMQTGTGQPTCTPLATLTSLTTNASVFVIRAQGARLSLTLTPLSGAGHSRISVVFGAADNMFGMTVSWLTQAMGGAIRSFNRHLWNRRFGRCAMRRRKLAMSSFTMVTVL